MSFSARQAKALQPGEHIIVDDAPGLRLIARESRTTWLYRYKSPVDGRMRQVALGHWPEISYPKALAVWDQLRKRRDAGEDLAKEKKRAVKIVEAQSAALAAEGIYTVGQLIEDYLQGHIARHRKPKGAAETRRLMVDYTTKIQTLEPGQITRAQAFGLLESIAAHAPVLANSLRTELGAAWEYALDAGRIPESVQNWWRQILRGKLRSRGKIVHGKHQGVQKRALQPAEVGQLIRYLPNFSPLISDLLTMYLWTGARGSEIVAMVGAEISDEPDGVWWTIPRERLKMSRNESLTDLRVPLVGRALNIVRRRCDTYGASYLFPARPGAATLHVEQKVVGVATWSARPDSATPYENSLRPRLQMEPWTPHDLRRTVRTQLAALGCPSDVAESVLGHILPEATYNRHQYDKERRVWLLKLSQHWEQLAAQ